ncbi:DUF4149 domain-containing protein [Variovorax sp. YR752]|uniref:DUF4149 domain-containing protein n=1 Tax=Variovorax sp. YR752 TaxID=1884383 RepID=UPI003137710E
MDARFGRAMAVVAGLWAGVLLAIALIGAPAGFAVLAERADAGRVAGHMFVREAYLSLGLAVVLFILERGRARRAADEGQGSALSTELLLLAGVLFCTVAGYFALQPMMAAARAGQGTLSFGALHAISTVFYGLKTSLVLVLAWRLSRPRAS